MTQYGTTKYNFCNAKSKIKLGISKNESSSVCIIFNQMRGISHSAQLLMYQTDKVRDMTEALDFLYQVGNKVTNLRLVSMCVRLV